MQIFYQTKDRNFNLEQELRLRFGSIIRIKNQAYISRDFSNVALPKNYSGPVIVLYAPVIPKERGVECKNYIYTEANNGLVVRPEKKYNAGFEGTSFHFDSFPKVTLYSECDHSSPELEESLYMFLSQNYAGKMDYFIFYSSEKAHSLGAMNFDGSHKRVRLLKEPNDRLEEINKTKPQVVLNWEVGYYFSPSFILNLIQEINSNKNWGGISDPRYPEVVAWYNYFWTNKSGDVKLTKLSGIEGRVHPEQGLDLREVKANIEPRQITKREWIAKKKKI